MAEGGGGGALATREAMALADMACPLVLQRGPPLCAGWGWGGGSRGGEGVRGEGPGGGGPGRGGAGRDQMRPAYPLSL